MAEISDSDYVKTIQELIIKKGKEIKGGTTRIRNYKIAHYIASKGFEQNLIWEILGDDANS